MTNAPSVAGDRYYVYRPMLDLLGVSEGTDKGRGYNETLGYGAYTGGDVNLVGMTLDQIDKLQTKMLQHPKNKLRSSALGRYQIIRTTLRATREQLSLTGKELYDAEMQDRLGCYLLGLRGIDKYLAGRLSEDTLLANLAHEWASLPLPSGKGAYGGQRAAVTPAQVRAVLAEVRARHKAGQPVETVEKPVVPAKVEDKVKEKTSWWQKVTGVVGGGGVGAGWLFGLDWQTVAIIAGAAVLILLLIVLLRRQIIGAVEDIRRAVEER